MTIRQSKFKPLWIVLILVVLCSCLCVSTLAWLTKYYEYNDDNSHIGKIDIAIYANGVKVTGSSQTIDGVTRYTVDSPYESSGGLTRNLNLKIRNEGTIDALVRATISIYYLENNNKSVAISKSTPTLVGQVSMTSTNWITDFKTDALCGNMYYNSKLEPYVQKTTNTDGTISETNVANREISVVDSIVVSSEQSTTKFYVDLTVDAVAYNGNIYKQTNGLTQNQIDNLVGTPDLPVLAYPFGSKDTLPSTWTAWQ